MQRQNTCRCFIIICTASTLHLRVKARHEHAPSVCLRLTPWSSCTSLLDQSEPHGGSVAEATTNLWVIYICAASTLHLSTRGRHEHAPSVCLRLTPWSSCCSTSLLDQSEPHGGSGSKANTIRQVLGPGGGGKHSLPTECRWQRRARTFEHASASHRAAAASRNLMTALMQRQPPSCGCYISFCIASTLHPTATARDEHAP